MPCPQNNGFKPRPEDIEAAITPKTKWVLLNFPGNPTGAVPTRAEMRAIAEVLLRHPHVWVMTDDMYEHLLYDGFEFSTIAEVEPAPEGPRTLTVNGCSKTYAMTGWRVGFGGGPARADQGHVQHAGPGDRRRLHHQPGRRRRRARRAAGLRQARTPKPTASAATWWSRC